MAERRMFSRGITGSARFLRMPQGARLLSCDLGMAADGDGVAETFTVLRATGAAEDDLRGPTEINLADPVIANQCRSTGVTIPPFCYCLEMGFPRHDFSPARKVRTGSE